VSAKNNSGFSFSLIQVSIKNFDAMVFKILCNFVRQGQENRIEGIAPIYSEAN
jgi:hypothetical protein